MRIHVPAIIFVTALLAAACTTAPIRDVRTALIEDIDNELRIGDPPETIEAFFAAREIQVDRYNLTPAYYARVPGAPDGCDVLVIIMVDDNDHFLDAHIQDSCEGIDPTQ